MIESKVSKNNNRKTLVVLVPDYRGRSSTLNPLKEMLGKKSAVFSESNCVFLPFDYHEHLLSNKNPETISKTLSATIEAKYEKYESDISTIILFGHSMGSALVRRAFLNAMGFSELPYSKKEWAGCVKRIILAGAFGRGFDIDRQPWISFRRPVTSRLVLKLVERFCQIFGIGKMLREMLKGADFISRLRVDWIRFNETNLPKPEVIHLLGTNDDIVHQDQVIDIEQFPGCIPIEVPNETHFSVAIPTPNTEDQLLHAFLGQSKPTRIVTPQGCKYVYFFVHGIRSSKTCFAEVAKRVEVKYPGEGEVGICKSSYGNFSAWDFMFTRHRNKYVSWFLDQYAEALAQNPTAEFCCAGHSNGTYIIGEALKRVPSINFRNVYLAGSVLPQEFDWKKIIDSNKQVIKVRSDRGSKDWIVGIFARMLNKLGSKSIGSAGYDEFLYGKDHLAENVIPGGHSSMLGDKNVDSIVNFLISGNPSEVKVEKDKQGFLFKLLFHPLHKLGWVLLPVFGVCIISALSILLWINFGLWGPVIMVIILTLIYLILDNF